MNSKSLIQKLAEKRISYPKRYVVLSAIASFVLWLVWGLTLPSLEVTMPELEFTLATKPKYFPEAPLWHIGLYIGSFVTMTYSVFGLIDRLLNRQVRSKSVQTK